MTVHYAGDTRPAQAQQILVLSPDHGPYLQSDDIRPERFDDATRHIPDLQELREVGRAAIPSQPEA
ncbi:hypothetical protein [Kitasatospora sp. NPDC058190]|uniref:hypothetical protein n=1 Tax=Kitasatospora sp. NPDC058190 TaxID=3346371 RepID=UPI0036DBAF93